MKRPDSVLKKKTIGNMSTITTFILYLAENKKFRKKGEVVTKRRGIAVFVLYVQIQIGRIFLYPESNRNLKELKKN